MKKEEEKVQAGASKTRNSTHQYEKEISLTGAEQKEIIEKSEKPITELFDSMKIDQRLKDILCYALGMINSN